MPFHIPKRWSILVILLLIPAADSVTCAQELVPVTSRKEVGWGNSAGELPTPVNANPTVPGRPQDLEELPGYAGGPDRMSDTITQRYTDGRPHIVRQVTQDEQGNFLNHGTWQLLNRRGETMADGHFENGQMHGAWERWHAADSSGLFSEPPFNQFRGPFLSTATFHQGKLDGTWIILDQYRRKVFEMPYVNGQRHGRSFWYRPNGLPFREVDFQEGQLHGQLIEYNEDNEPTREATFVQGQEIIERTTYYFRNQRRAQTSFIGPRREFRQEDDWWNAEPARYETVGTELKHGPTREWYPNGQLRVAGQYRQGKQDGTFRWWHENGQKQIEGSFTQGQKTGTWGWWHDNGQKAIEGSYLNDLETGMWTWWSEEGDLEDQRDFNLESIESLDAPDSGNSGEALESLEALEAPGQGRSAPGDSFSLDIDT